MDFALAARLFGACAVVALVLLALRAVATLGVRPGALTGRRGRLLSVVETAMLPGAASLHVVRIAERYFAIGRSGGHIATLCELPVESLARPQEARGRPPLRSFLRRR